MKRFWTRESTAGLAVAEDGEGVRAEDRRAGGKEEAKAGRAMKASPMTEQEYRQEG